jgi:hypothetical protein
MLPPVLSLMSNLYVCATGFHEDGFTSGLKAATTIPLPGLRVSLPFQINSPDRDGGSVNMRKFSGHAFTIAEAARRLISIIIWWALGIISMASISKRK